VDLVPSDLVLSHSLVETDGRRRETVPVKKDSRPKKREIERERGIGRENEKNFPPNSF